MPFVTVTVCVVNPEDEGHWFTPLQKRYVTVPPAVGEAPVRVAVSWTVSPALMGDTRGSPVASSMTVVLIEGVKKIAEVASARSCAPVLAPFSVSRNMWYGDPLMKLAEFPTPQSCWLAMWPPQARTTVLPPVGPDAGVVNVTRNPVEHWPVPEGTWMDW